MVNRYQTSLSEKRQLTSDIWLFSFKLINPNQIDFQAGQYLILKVDNQSRLYSIFSSNRIKDRVDFLLKIIPGGLASKYFHQLQLGDRVEFEGPAGVFTLKENEKDKVFLVTSTGLAPVYSMILSFIEKNVGVIMPNFYLFWGLKNYEDVCFFKELKQLTIDHRQLKLFICLSREQNLDKIPEEDKSLFRVGRVNNVWEEYVNQSLTHENKITMSQFINQYDYYICGSRVVVDSLNQYLLTKDISKENIYFEKF